MPPFSIEKALLSAEVVQCLESLPSSLFVARKDGTLVFANEKARHSLSLSSAQLSQKNVADVIAPIERLQEALDGLRCTVKVPPQKNITHVGISVSRFTSCIEEGCLLVLFRDISCEVKTRQERDRLLQLAAVAETMPSLLHELKNPLASVVTLIELALEDVSQGSYEGLSNDLHATLSELRRIKVTLEGVGMVGRNLRSEQFGAVDYAITETCRVFEKKAQSRSLTLQVDVKAMPLLRFDLASLRALVFNLLNNACQASKEGGFIKVIAQLNNKENTLELSICDDGKGMSKETLANCKQLFFSTKKSGSGIGLALVDRMVREVGGKLEIQSELALGCTVAIRLPIHAPEKISNTIAAP